MSVVSFQNPGRYSGLRLRELRALVESLLDELAPETDSFVVRFASDREMTRLNLRFRELDKTTDVLSFPGEAGPEGRHLGDVVISVPMARRQAMAAGHTLENEICVLVLHGLLHCMGYDHETDRGQMERLERRLRRKYLGERMTRQRPRA